MRHRCQLVRLNKIRREKKKRKKKNQKSYALALKFEVLQSVHVPFRFSLSHHRKDSRRRGKRKLINVRRHLRRKRVIRNEWGVAHTIRHESVSHSSVYFEQDTKRHVPPKKGTRIHLQIVIKYFPPHSSSRFCFDQAVAPRRLVWVWRKAHLPSYVHHLANLQVERARKFKFRVRTKRRLRSVRREAKTKTRAELKGRHTNGNRVAPTPSFLSFVLALRPLSCNKNNT